MHQNLVWFYSVKRREKQRLDMQSSISSPTMGRERKGGMLTQAHPLGAMGWAKKHVETQAMSVFAVGALHANVCLGISLAFVL